MTDKQIRSLCKWAGVLADEFGLSSWKIRVHVGNPGSTDTGSDAIASVDCVYGRRIANIEIDPAFLTVDPEEQRHVILHEFLHIHTHQVLSLMRGSLPLHLGQPAFDAFMGGITLADEHAIDGLATAVERFFPLWEG